MSRATLFASTRVPASEDDVKARRYTVNVGEDSGELVERAATIWEIAFRDRAWRHFFFDQPRHADPPG